MANKAAAGGQDNLSLDDVKLDEFPVEDNALFADLDNEMRAGDGKDSDPGAALDDLNLDFDVKADAAPAQHGAGEAGVDDTMDLELSLDDAPAESAPTPDSPEDFDLGESTVADSSAVEDDLNLEFDEGTASASDGAGDLDLNLDGVSAGTGDLDLDAAPADLDLGEAPEAALEPSGSEMPDLAAEPVADLDLGSIDAPQPSPDESEGGGDFAAAPDINLDDIDLELDMPGGRGSEMEDLGETSLEPKGAQVDLEQGQSEDVGVIKEFQMPPLADIRGDDAPSSAEEFEAMPDVELPEDDVLHLNLGPEDPGAPQPEFTMAPELAQQDAEVAEAEEILLGEPAQAELPPAPVPAAAVPQDLLLSIPHRLSVQMGAVSLLGRDIRGLAYGSVVQLNRTVGEPVDLLLDGKTIAQGEIVLINGKNLGVRILALNK